MGITNESAHTGAHIVSEASGTRSREEIVILANAGPLAAGTVLGKVTASGKYVAYNEAGTDDGRRVAAGVLYAAVPADAADQPGIAHVRDCEVHGAELTGSDAAGIADLRAIGIIVR